MYEEYAAKFLVADREREAAKLYKNGTARRANQEAPKTRQNRYCGLRWLRPELLIALPRHWQRLV